MSFRRHDTLTTHLGERRDRNTWRLWIEETSYDRLSRNNFSPNTGFNVRRRPGLGLIIEPAMLSSFHVSRRRGASLLSYESRDLADVFGSPELRVRIDVGHILVVPLLRLHSVARPQTEVWTVTGDSVSTPAGVAPLRTTVPTRIPQTAEHIRANLQESNLVCATEFIGNHRPARVTISGEPILLTVAGQFLRACGYAETGAPGEFLR